MAVIDIFTFNGEYDILEIRLNILGDYVDQFIIIEAPTTFSGLPKPLYYEQGKERYKRWEHKIKYFVIDENFDEGILALADGSPTVPRGGASHWKREFCQKESIKKALEHLDDYDLCYVSDVDEIWNPKWTSQAGGLVIRLEQLVYTYYLNNRSSEPWTGTIVTRYNVIKNECLNYLRSVVAGTRGQNGGWHFTSMAPEMRRKLLDSYTNETYANDWVMNNLEENIKNNKDFLGRGFTYNIDESEWPQYLKDNKEKYVRLLRNVAS